MTDQEIADGLQYGEIKPEFGNPQHIRAVRYLERLAEEEGDEGEKLYTVSFDVVSSYSVEVWAKDRDEAKEIALDTYDESDEFDSEVQGVQITEMKQEENDAS